MDFKYIAKLLPSAGKTFTIMMGVIATVLLVSYSFNILGEALGLGMFGGQVICMVSVLIASSLLLAHVEQKQVLASAESKAKLDEITEG